MPNMKFYFPSKYAKSRSACRTYFYNVWNTLHPNEVRDVIDHANKQRFTISNEQVQEEAIIITDEWKREIDSYPFISKKKGKMSSLLKKKSKIIKVKKDRKTYEAFDFSKRMRAS